ncbi:hypothetical protein EI165_10295 [Pseudoalteromonas nigrifaciens]|uniref:hypothetical protein n=1 Tax=Pseudoalteromonas nigrifaciens TaxID=28109 RepID=UPI0017882318|nr:hypothetical protein [Pseudoalteromonas nigrifaciens]MBE0420510.1 hypothetical protein [Pseudoalteromonas nigrifaciens]
MKILFLFLGLAFISSSAKATFYIDYQDLEKKEAEKTERKQLISPDGYRLLTDDHSGLIYEIGKRIDVKPISSFADDISFKEGIGAILPKGWSAYLDEHLNASDEISFSADKEHWLTVLARIGNNYGYKFIVDWQQKIVQITSDENYIKPNPNDPLPLEGSDGQMYYIYKSKQSINNGVILVDGKVIPLKITN